LDDIVNAQAVAEARKPKAADITDDAMLAAIRQAIVDKNTAEREHPNPWFAHFGLPPSVWTTASRWEIGTVLGEEWPEKVVLAKLRSMTRRGLVDGCPCGCRGDFGIIERTA
jgi:hypothetical protein